MKFLLLSLLFSINSFSILFCDGLNVSQNNYELNFQSGKVLPVEIKKPFIFDMAYFSNGLFEDKYYILIQFYEIPKLEEMEQFKALGIEFLEYIPNNAYFVSYSQQLAIKPENVHHLFANVRSVIPILPIYKVDNRLTADSLPSYAIKETGTIDLVVSYFKNLHYNNIESYIIEKGFEVISVDSLFHNFTIRINPNDIYLVSSLSFVRWVSPISTPIELYNRKAKISARSNNLQSSIPINRNLKGDSINIGIWDGYTIYRGHTDFRNRVVIPEWNLPPFSSQIYGREHAFSVTGTIGGAGLIDPRSEGMATKANLYSFFSSKTTLYHVLYNNLYNVDVSSNSYGR